MDSNHFIWYMDIHLLYCMIIMLGFCSAACQKKAEQYPFSKVASWTRDTNKIYSYMDFHCIYCGIKLPSLIKDQIGNSPDAYTRLSTGPCLELITIINQYPNPQEPHVFITRWIFTFFLPSFYHSKCSCAKY